MLCVLCGLLSNLRVTKRLYINCYFAMGQPRFDAYAGVIFSVFCNHRLQMSHAHLFHSHI
jgi:hypothetical protein